MRSIGFELIHVPRLLQAIRRGSNFPHVPRLLQAIRWGSNFPHVPRLLQAIRWGSIYFFGSPGSVSQTGGRVRERDLFHRTWDVLKSLKRPTTNTQHTPTTTHTPPSVGNAFFYALTSRAPKTRLTCPS